RFYTVNANTVGTLERVMNSIKFTDSAGVRMAQELQADAAKLDDFRARMHKQGWRIGLAGNTRTSGGWSAGVLIAALCSHGFDYARRGVDTWDISPKGPAGRLAIASGGAALQQGLLRGGVYLWNSEGSATRNQQILPKWAPAVEAARQAWMLGGGFNMDPSDLHASGLLGRMKGSIVRDQQTGSCGAGGEAGVRNTSDYLIVSTSLAVGPLTATALEGFNVAPHLPVRKEIAQMGSRSRKPYKLTAPKRWPIKLPVGCAAPPTPRPRPFARAGNHERADIDEHWGNAGQAHESHLNRFFNFDGDELATRMGHFELPKYKWQDIEVPAAAEATAVRAWAEGAEWLARNLKHLHDSASARIAKGPPNHPIAMPLFAKRAPDQEATRSDEDDGDTPAPIQEGGHPGEGADATISWNTTNWPDIASTPGYVTADATTDCELHYVFCMTKLLDLASRRSWLALHRASTASWRRWVRAHGQRGAGAIHRRAKPTSPWTPQATAGVSQDLEDHALVHPQADWHPRQWQLGGYAGAARVASVLNATEAGAPWPAAQAAILFHLLAKPSGGHRNLGLMPYLARLWETIRTPCARSWETKNRRDYDWAARGRSSERAAWMQALFCESTAALDLDYAVAYFDLVKYFEFVAHAKAWEAGLHWGFNRAIPRATP
ncbi:unnamed protein product, partial [Prorocentrum cordatum]